MRRAISSALLAIGLASIPVACGTAAPPQSVTPMSFGVLGSTCAPERVTALREAGVTVVEMPLGWDRYEPEAGRVDPGYVAELQANLKRCREAGLDVVLAPGLHYPPDWVTKLRGGVLKGSKGGTADSAGAELVFSAEVRSAAQRYLARMVSDLGLQGIAAIRVGTNGGGELGYPGPDGGGNENEFWAFGDAPQHGEGLAAGVAHTPMPGWVPGDREWNGKPVTDAQVQGWWDWYAGSAVGAVVWQVKELRKLGYEGRVHVPVAGRGVLPSDRAEALKGRLDGRANPDGAQERGLDYPSQFQVLSTLPGLDVDFTGLDDVTAVRARAIVPRQDQCRPNDEENVLEATDVSLWSSHRFTSAIARRTGLGLVGENPGPPDAPNTGGSPLSDSLADQLRIAPIYAVECGMTMFLFGFEDNLFEGEESGVSPSDYEEVIREVRNKENG